MISILIPTFNRANLLNYCLTNLEFMEDQDEPFEIVISDNCSQDHTADIVKKHQKTKPYIKYYKMKTHKSGGLGNYNNALRRCEGEFCMFHADDDKLIPETFLKYLKQLKNSGDDVVAITAPFTGYNDATGKVDTVYVDIQNPFRFSFSDIPTILEWTVEKDFFPEIMIYKTTAHQNALSTDSIYKGSESMEIFFNLLLQGDILVEKDPYYLEITQHKPEMNFDARQRSNIHFEMAAPDNVQHGIEVFMGRLLQMLYPNGAPEEIMNAMKLFALQKGSNRQIVARRKYLAFNNYIHAKHLFWRTSLYVNHPQETIQQDIQTTILSCIQSVIFTAKSIDIDKIYLSSFDNNKIIQSAFEILGWNQVVEPFPNQFIDDAIVLVKNNADRQKILDCGFQNGFVISIESLVNNFKSQSAHIDLAGL